ncbi:unnamed protein product [Adineta steineri]|uniref:G-protein coupled receptors family 1 profile domain-containing protein n=1 Tax=Adineta steineri TaxID=433720 RepID=A0A816C794_9BILA|nr:unnamed protein product [Adineta steineri]CAF1620965.1 unnamed protein product [Adineta steineri]
MDIDVLFRIIKFWIYLILLIPSIICSLFVLCYLLFDRNLHRALHNHVIIILLLICLICQVTIYPWMLYFYNNHIYWPRSYIFCSIWGFIDWGLYITQIILFAWASIERHILIFHDRWLSTRRKRIFIHYLPPILLLLYCFIFYGIVYFFPFCVNSINYYAAACIVCCTYNNNVFSLWETIVNQLLPHLIIIIFSIALILRALWQNHRVHQRIQWRKHRKMTIQLLSISFLYLTFSFPNTFMIFLYLCGLPSNTSGDVKKYAEFFSYLIILFFPFVCILPLSKLRNKIRKILLCRKRRQTRFIRPEILTARQTK